MRNKFKKALVKRLTRCFSYCPKDRHPSIQVGKADGSGDLIFWLKYDDNEINKCAASLINELGDELAITDMKEAKEILLKSMAIGFNAIDANFLSIQESDGPVFNILSDVHFSNLEMMFEDYVSNLAKELPYFYLLRYTKLSGRVDLNDYMRVYGAGLLDLLLSDINNDVGISIPKEFIDEPFMRNEPLDLYKRLHDSAIVLIYAKSNEDAILKLNQFFGAVCVSIDKPFRINNQAVDNRICYVNDGSVNTLTARINIPSLNEIILHVPVIENIKCLLSNSNKRLKSALSFIAHGWTYDERERFINHFIALDALYGTERGNKESVINGVTSDASSIDSIHSKISSIYELRCKFIHGEIPTLHKHGKYLGFVEEHGLDPTPTIFNILIACVNNYHKNHYN
jgi:hypothetical protein